MGKVFHSCGHEDAIRPISGWPIMLKSETCDSEEGYIKCVEHKTVCHSCYIRYVTNYPDDLIFSEWEVGEYLG